MALTWNTDLNTGAYIKIDDFVNNIKIIAKKYVGQENCSTYDVSSILTQFGYQCNSLQSGSIVKQSDINNLKQTLDAFYDNWCNSNYTSKDSTVDSAKNSTEYYQEKTGVYNGDNLGVYNNKNSTVYNDECGTNKTGYDVHDYTSDYSANEHYDYLTDCLTAYLEK